MFSEDPILLPEIVDQIVLVTVHPASEREDEELQRRRHSLRLLGRLDQHRPSLGRFFAPYAVTSQKTGTSALALQQVLGFGSYQTAWAWLHKLRRAMVRPGRDRLSGRVEVDETFVGGLEDGISGRGAVKKVLIAVAAEDVGRGSAGFDCGGCRTRQPTASRDSSTTWSSPGARSTPTAGSATTASRRTATGTASRLSATIPGASVINCW